jgi:AcrR family transcriptional regulator
MDSSPSATRKPKQARAIRTRERILDQAEQAFAAKGYEAASLTSDILDPAGISVGSFYHQFVDKRAVLYTLLDERRAWRDVSVALAAAAGAEPTFRDAVRHGMLRLLDDIDEHPAAWWIHCRELASADPEIRRLVEQSWASLIDSLRAILEARVDDPAARTPGRLAFAASGLTGVLRTYLTGEAGSRRHLRDDLLDDVVAACVASFVD